MRLLLVWWFIDVHFNKGLNGLPLDYSEPSFRIIERLDHFKGFDIHGGVPFYEHYLLAAVLWAWLLYFLFLIFTFLVSASYCFTTWFTNHLSICLLFIWRHDYLWNIWLRVDLLNGRLDFVAGYCCRTCCHASAHSLGLEQRLRGGNVFRGNSIYLLWFLLISFCSKLKCLVYWFGELLININVDYPYNVLSVDFLHHFWEVLDESSYLRLVDLALLFVIYKFHLVLSRCWNFKYL